MYFHPKLAWPPATYDVISRNRSNWPSLNLSQNVREGWMNSYWKLEVLMFYPLGKNLKTMGEGVRPTVKKWMSVACFLLLTIWLSVLKRQGAANWRRYTFYLTKRGNKGRVEINRDVSFTDTVLWFQIWFFCNYCFLLWLMLLLFWATRYLRNSWYRSMLLNSQFFQRFDLPM